MSPNLEYLQPVAFACHGPNEGPLDTLLPGPEMASKRDSEVREGLADTGDRAGSWPAGVASPAGAAQTLLAR